MLYHTIPYQPYNQEQEPQRKADIQRREAEAGTKLSKNPRCMMMESDELYIFSYTLFFFLFCCCCCRDQNPLDFIRSLSLPKFPDVMTDDTKNIKDNPQDWEAPIALVLAFDPSVLPLTPKRYAPPPT